MKKISTDFFKNYENKKVSFHYHSFGKNKKLLGKLLKFSNNRDVYFKCKILGEFFIIKINKNSPNFMGLGIE